MASLSAGTLRPRGKPGPDVDHPTSPPPAKPVWRFVITDIAGNNLGQPDAFERQFSAEISAVSTAGFRINDSDPLFDTIVAGKTMLRVYDTLGQLQLFGPVIATSEAASGQGTQVKVTAADLAWRLGHRFAFKDTSGVGQKYSNTDAGTIAHGVLNDVNSDEATGITVGTKDAFGTQSVTYLWKRALDAISELGAIAGSFEWKLRYVDGTPPTAYLDLKSSLGSDKSRSVFLEYGTGKLNCSAYELASSIDTLATDVYVIGAAGTVLADAYDVNARTTYKRHEDVLSFGDISVQSMLDALAAAHVAARDHPRVVASMTCTPQLAPGYGDDYVVGDILSARIVVRDKVRFAGQVRVWGVDVSIDELGNEAPTFRLAPS